MVSKNRYHINLYANASIKNQNNIYETFSVKGVAGDKKITKYIALREDRAQTIGHYRIDHL